MNSERQYKDSEAADDELTQLETIPGAPNIEAGQDTGTESEVDGSSDADTTFEANNYELAVDTASDEEEEEEKFDILTLMEKQRVPETQLDQPIIGSQNTEEGDDTGTESEVDGNSDADTTFEADSNEPLDIIEILMAGSSDHSKNSGKQQQIIHPMI